MSVEVTLDVDGFGNNKKLSGNDAIARHIVSLLIQKKNTDPLNPDKGVDINSYIPLLDDTGVMSQIKNEIFEQIAKYLPYSPSDVMVKPYKHNLVIVISLIGSSEAFFFASDGVKTSFDIIKDS